MPERILRGGFVNTVVYDEELNLVRKKYKKQAGIATEINSRIEAEVDSMELFSFTPTLIGEFDKSIEMEYVLGIYNLNEVIGYFNPELKRNTLTTVGSILSQVHQHKSIMMTPSFHTLHQNHYKSTLHKSSNSLSVSGLDVGKVDAFLDRSYQRSTVESEGLTWTHGDFWLNNIIGNVDNDTFIVNKVIDWELSGYNSPYRDFATVFWSIEKPFDQNRDFWKGYGKVPNDTLVQHFATIKFIDWVHGEGYDFNPKSSFYEPKIELIKKWLD